MKRWTVVLTLALAFASSAHADDASRLAKTRELFVVMRMQRTIQQTMDIMLKQIHQMTESMPGAGQLTPEQKKLTEEFQQKVEALVLSQLGWKAVEPAYVELYAKTFSEEEIDGLLAFYKSTVGQTLLEKTPELTTEAGAISQARMIKLQPQMNELMLDFMKRLKATTTAPKPAPSTHAN